MLVLDFTVDYKTHTLTQQLRWTGEHNLPRHMHMIETNTIFENTILKIETSNINFGINLQAWILTIFYADELYLLLHSLTIFWPLHNYYIYTY